MLKVIEQKNLIVTVELNGKKYNRCVRFSETGHVYIKLNNDIHFVDGWHAHLCKVEEEEVAEVKVEDKVKIVEKTEIEVSVETATEEKVEVKENVKYIVEYLLTGGYYHKHTEWNTLEEARNLAKMLNSKWRIIVVVDEQ